MDIRKTLWVKSLRELLTITASLSRNNKTQATNIQKEEIRKSIKWSYVKGTSQKLWRIPKWHKTRSPFATENTLHKLLDGKPKGRLATEDKNNIIC